MRARLLGGFSVEGIDERDLGSRKGRTVLKLLAVARGSPVSVERIADVLWGDEQPARPADQVGVLVSRLRGVLGAETITRTDAGYVLRTDWLDVDELDALVEGAALALDEGRVGAARAAVDAALGLARGPLLPDEDSDWVGAERTAVDAVVGRARRIAIDAAIRAGDHDGAVAIAERALLADPYDEVVLRSLMRSHLAVGRPAAALAAYGRVRARLAEDLGVSPTAETESVYTTALAAADGDDRPATPRPGAVDGIVGRAAELARLDTALAEIVGGGASLVVVSGDAGIGKTTLVDGWTVPLEPEVTVLRGRCDPLGRDLPLQPIADALADHLQMVGAERAAVVVGDDAATLAPLLGPIAGHAATVVTDAEAGRLRIFAALVSVIGRAGDGRTTLVVVEDLHLAEPGTRAWLTFARRRCRSTLFVVTTRPDGDRGVEPDHRIALGPLPRDAVRELVGPERADALYARSGGYPLLIAALATAPDEALPASVSDAVAARVDSLGADVAATLRWAAVVGDDCDLDLIAHVTGTTTLEVLGHLERAARVGLIVEQGSRFRFRHELVRDALETAIPAPRRALVHREAARALAARPDADALAVAVHAKAGGDVGLASAWFITAATAAAARFDVDAAEEHLSAALELGPNPDALVARSRVRMSRLALDAAADDAERAVALSGGPGALEAAGWVAYYRRRYDEALAYAEEAATRATDAAVRISARALAGRVRHGAGDLAGAVEHLAAAGDGPHHVRGIADVWLAQVRLHQGRPTDALAALARPMVDPDSLAHPWAPLHLRFNRVMALGQVGRVTDALEVAADLDRAVEREGAVGARFRAPAANVAAWILRWSGRTEEADERNRMALDVSGGSDGPRAEALAEGHYVALLDLADGCLVRGDTDGAAEVVVRLAPVDHWRGTMAWHQRHRLDLLRARLALADGDADRAATLASSVADDAAARGAGRYELLARAVLGLADPTLPPARLAPVVDGLGRCAALDGWPLVAALAARHRVDAWRAEADRRAAAMIAAAGPHGDAARRFADGVLNV